MLGRRNKTALHTATSTAEKIDKEKKRKRGGTQEILFVDDKEERAAMCRGEDIRLKLFSARYLLISTIIEVANRAEKDESVPKW